ncbi:MAG: hypothetical protein R3F56_06295 [Planctomycetota bacterium]
MRFLLLAALAAASVPLHAQTPNIFEIYSGCTNFTSRGSIGSNAGEYLLQVPATHFSGLGHDPTGGSTILAGFRYTTQDQNGVTPETYSMVMRGDTAGTPDCSAAGLLLTTGNLTTPPNTTVGAIAWVITLTFTTPSTAMPLCATFYQGGQFPAAPGWTPGTDGQSLHIVDYALGDTAAPTAPSLSWNCLGGAPVQPNFQETVRVDALVQSAVLNMGSVDPTTIVTCLQGLNNRSFGAGGLWPYCTGSAGPRNDGIDCRVRDATSAGGVFALFLGSNVGCPGVPLGGIANGALYLNPSGGFVQVVSGTLSTTGEGIATVVPPNTPCARFVNRYLDFQAFTVGASFALPGNLTNRASVSFR